MFELDDKDLRKIKKDFDSFGRVRFWTLAKTDAQFRPGIENAFEQRLKEQFADEGKEGASYTEGSESKTAGKLSKSWLPFSKRYAPKKKKMKWPSNKALYLTGKLYQTLVGAKVKMAKNDFIVNWTVRSPKGFPYSDVHQEFRGSKPLGKGQRRRSVVITKELFGDLVDRIMLALTKYAKKI